MTFDVRDTAAAPSVVEYALERFGRIDVLVNNAGRGMVGAAEMVDDSTLRDLMELHLIGPAALVRAVPPVDASAGQRDDRADEQSRRPYVVFPVSGRTRRRSSLSRVGRRLSPVRSRSSAFG